MICLLLHTFELKYKYIGKFEKKINYIKSLALMWVVPRSTYLITYSINPSVFCFVLLNFVL